MFEVMEEREKKGSNRVGEDVWSFWLRKRVCCVFFSLPTTD
jgi:hypothetical protein